jgi:hypothetical protein
MTRQQLPRHVAGPRLDYVFIAFPIWVPIVYFTLISSFPEYSAIFFLMVMLLLGEPHFAATWFFFLDERNRKWLLDNKFYFIFLPLFIAVILIIVGTQVSAVAALFPILIFNLFHVMRQSIGVLKMYAVSPSRSLTYGLWAVYAFSTFFILIGLIRFNYKIDIAASGQTSFVVDEYIPFILPTSAGVIMLVILAIFYVAQKEGARLIYVATVLTGLIMFMPLLFMDKIEHAFAMGVGMHYTQYLAITIPLYLRRSRIDARAGANRALRFVASNIYTISVYLLIYAGLMVFLANYAFFTDVSEVYMQKEFAIFLIPITFQTLHFYADTFIWRFSTPHIRSEIYPHLFAPTTGDTR